MRFETIVESGTLEETLTPTRWMLPLSWPVPSALMAEWGRIFHGVDTMTAEETVDRIVETYRASRMAGGRNLERVLAPGFTMREKMLSCFTTLLGGSTRRHCWRG